LRAINANYERAKLIDDVVAQLRTPKAAFTLLVGAHEIKLTHLDRVYWPAEPALAQPALTGDIWRDALSEKRNLERALEDRNPEAPRPERQPLWRSHRGVLPQCVAKRRHIPPSMGTATLRGQTQHRTGP
jgi:hypothetical protein